MKDSPLTRFMDRWNLKVLHVQLLFGVTEQTVYNWVGGGELSPTAQRLLDVLLTLETLHFETVNLTIYNLKLQYHKRRSERKALERDEKKRQQHIDRLLRGAG